MNTDERQARGAALRASRRLHARVRAQALVDLAEGRVSLNDVLLRATRPEGADLLRVPIRQFLLAIPGVGEATVKAVMRRLETFNGRTGAPSSPDIRWLLDGRSHGTRVVALADAVLAAAPAIRFDTRGGRRSSNDAPRSTPPWHRFPYGPPHPRHTSRLGDHIRRTPEGTE